MSSVLDLQLQSTEKTISRAIGEELRRAREALGWSRLQLVSRLPSGIGERTLLSYEHRTRHLTLLRFIQICLAMGVDSATVHSHGLQRARIHLEAMNLQVDLHEMLRDTNTNAKFRPMVQWARNNLNENPEGVVEVQPAVVRNLALFVGCSREDLTNYLAQFIPDYNNTNGREATRRT